MRRILGERPSPDALTSVAELDRAGRAALRNGCWSRTTVSRFGRDPSSLAAGDLLDRTHMVVAGTG